MRFQYIALGAAVCVAASLSLTGVLPAYRCPFATFLGISCPTCGTTRAWMSFFRGNIADAFFYNPLFLVWGVFGVVGLGDLFYAGITGEIPTIGQRWIAWIADSKARRAAHIFCFGSLLFYVNTIGPTAKMHLFSSPHQLMSPWKPLPASL